MSLFEQLLLLEQADDLHLARLLVLLDAFSGSDGTKTVDGLTKLAKLDFLLRYPVYLERALPERKGKAGDANVREHERHSVESQMIRFKYGPWDDRYRRLLNLLIAKRLARVETSGRTISIGLTPDGLAVAEEMAARPEFSDLQQRAKLLKRHFDLSATNLMKFVYETFPEIGTLRYGRTI